MTESERRQGNLTQWLIAIVGFLLIINASLWLGRTLSRPIEASTRPTTSQAATPRDVPAESPVELTGPGHMNTDPFSLAGGAYRVRATAGDCAINHFYLKATTGGYSEVVAQVDAQGERDSNIYNVPPGEYYVLASTGTTCPWTLRLTPQ